MASQRHKYARLRRRGGTTETQRMITFLVKIQLQMPGLTSLGFCWFANWSPYMEGKERGKEEVGCPRSVGGNLLSKGIYMQGLSLRAASPLAWILKVHIEALTGFSHILCPAGLSNTSLSRGCVLGTAPTVGTVSRKYLPRVGRGEEPLIALNQLTGQPAVTSFSRSSPNSFLLPDLVSIISSCLVIWCFCWFVLFNFGFVW